MNLRLSRQDGRRERVVEWVERDDDDAPVVPGLDWGHGNPIAPLPVSAEVIVDPAAAITFD